MPTVTYKGPWYSRPSRDARMPEWQRGRAVTVSQDWLDNWRHSLSPDFAVVGDEGAFHDLFNDGLPDSGWRRKEILDWLSDNGVAVSNGYKTKTALLALVEEALNPTPVEESVVETAEDETAEDETTDEE